MGDIGSDRRKLNSDGRGGRAAVAAVKKRGSGGAGETLFVSSAPNDLVPVAEPQLRLEGTVLVPEAGQPLVELLHLCRELRVVATRKLVPKLGATVAETLDLGLDLSELV